MTEKLKLSAFLPYRLSVLSNRISRAIADSYEDRFDLTLPEWRVMAVLGDSPNLSAREVADRTAMDKVMVSRAVARLIAAGRVTRRTDSADRRRSILALSEAGHQIYAGVAPMALGYEKALLAQLSAEDQAALDRVLAKLEAISVEDLERMPATAAAE